MESTTPPLIPDHTLLGVIGRGAYGEVWLGRNIMGTHRAVKVVHRRAFENPRPFEREFNGIRKFEPLSRTHSALVDILQVGRTEAYFYSVMELADDATTGQQVDAEHYQPLTLRRALQTAGGRFPIERCIEIALVLVQGLSHLHQHGLIHRDVKPSNIIFVHGQPKLADIGLVADAGEAKSFVGTEGFIPPEGPGTAQGDLFSLGKVLYEMATGKDRLEFPEWPLLSGTEDPGSVGFVELNSVILKACQPAPRDRYANAEAMRQDLLLLQSGKSVLRAQRIEARLARLRRASVVGGFVTALALAGLFLLQRQADRETQLRKRAEAGERQARRNLYAADMVLASRALSENNRGRAVALRSKYRPTKKGVGDVLQGGADADEDVRGWEWRFLWQRARSDELFTLGRHAKYVAGLALAPDGNTLYSASKDRTVGIWDLAARRQTGTLPHGRELRDLDLSRDGRLLATADKADVLRVWDTTKQTVQLARTNAGPLGFVRFTPDAKQLVHRDAEGVWVIDRLTGGRTSLLRHAHEEFRHMSGATFSQDGRLFAFDAGDSTIHLLDWESRTELGTLRYDESLSPDWGILGLTLSPNGRWLVAAGFDGLQAWEVPTRRKVWSVPRTGNENWNASPSFSPDGRLLVTVSTDQRVQLWDVTTWTEVTTLRGHEFEVWDAVFTPDGSRLITAGKDRTIRVWPVPQRTQASSGDEIGSTVGPHSKWHWDPSLGRRPIQVALPEDRARATLSRDGTQLVVLYENNQWAVSDPETGQLRNAGAWPENRSGSAEAAVSNDGQRVVFGVDRELVVYGALGSQEPLVRLAEGPRLTAHAQDVLCFAPNGRQVLFATASDAVRLLDPETGQVETLFQPTGRRVYSVNFSPDGRRVAAAYSGAVVRWRDLTFPEIHELQTDHSEFVISLAFSPDGEVLATGSFDPGVRLWRLRDGARIADLSGSLQGYLTVQFSTDGRRLAAGSFEGQINLWDMEQNPPLEVLQGLAHTSPGRPRPVFPLRLRTDGSLIAKSGSNLGIWWAPKLSEIDAIDRAEAIPAPFVIAITVE